MASLIQSEDQYDEEFIGAKYCTDIILKNPNNDVTPEYLDKLIQLGTVDGEFVHNLSSFSGSDALADISLYSPEDIEKLKLILSDLTWHKSLSPNHISCLGKDDYMETNAAPICASDAHDCCRCSKHLTDVDGIPTWFGVVCEDCLNLYRSMLSGEFYKALQLLTDFDDLWFWSDRWYEQFYEGALY